MKPRQSHGTTSNFQRNLHPAAIPFIIISLPFQVPSTVCRSPSQEPRYRKKVLLSKALLFPMCNKENRGIFHKWNIIAAVVLLITHREPSPITEPCQIVETASDFQRSHHPTVVPSIVILQSFRYHQTVTPHPDWTSSALPNVLQELTTSDRR